MIEVPPPPPDGVPGFRDRWILLASGCLALSPFVVYHRLFGRLFWFGDEFEMIDQIDRMGFWRWMWLFFGENFAPVFKLLWGGGFLAFQGSYAAMITMVWLTHALNVALLGRIMRTCGLPWVAVISAQVVFGLAPTTVETLAWSIQWSPMLSTTFMLLAFESFLRAPFRPVSLVWAAASSLSFARGLLTGPLLALASLWTRRGGAPLRPMRLAAYIAGCLLPVAVVGLLIAAAAAGNYNHMKGHWGGAAVFGAWFYCLNPAYLLLSVESWGWRTVVLLGLCKFALAGWAIARSGGRQRLLFILLVVFDLGNAALLGMGRYQTGLLAAVSSRYQYASLIGIAPMAGFWISRQWDRIPVPAIVRGIGAAILLAAGAFHLCQQWGVELDPFTASRGTDSRRILLLESHPDPHSVPGIPGLPVDRARELIAKYDLH
jgi:hypothetical protein